MTLPDASFDTFFATFSDMPSAFQVVSQRLDDREDCSAFASALGLLMSDTGGAPSAEADSSSSAGAGTLPFVVCACGSSKAAPPQDLNCSILLRCRTCLWWQHATCMGIRRAEEIPPSYECVACAFSEREMKRSATPGSTAYAASSSSSYVASAIAVPRTTRNHGGLGGIALSAPHMRRARATKMASSSAAIPPPPPLPSPPPPRQPPLPTAAAAAARAPSKSKAKSKAKPKVKPKAKPSASASANTNASEMTTGASGKRRGRGVAGIPPAASPRPSKQPKTQRSSSARKLHPKELKEVLSSPASLLIEVDLHHLLTLETFALVLSRKERAPLFSMLPLEPTADVANVKRVCNLLRYSPHLRAAMRLYQQLLTAGMLQPESQRRFRARQERDTAARGAAAEHDSAPFWAEKLGRMKPREGEVEKWAALDAALVDAVQRMQSEREAKQA